MVEVIPAILEKDFAEIEKKIHLVEGLVSWIQIDIADNTLLPNTTFLDPEPFAQFTTSVFKTGDAKEGVPTGASLVLNPPQAGDFEAKVGKLSRQDPLNFELHLMVKDPLRYLERFASVGFKRFYAHVEGDYVDEYIEKCNQLGVEAGLAIDGPTPFDRIHKYLDNLDCILVMAIEAGFSGRSFRDDTIEKIKKIREADLEIPISVDGAMIPENAKKVTTAGATRINSNSYIFQSPDVKIAIEKLKSIEDNRHL